MAANKAASNPVAHECQHKCNSQKHASCLAAALTRASLTDEEVAAYLKWCCVRYSKSVDLSGRTLLHLAASVGRPKLLVYLLKHRGVNINEKDKESHFTPLHRSLFYGNIDCAVRLIQHGANVDQPDLDNLTPFDLVIEDSPRSRVGNYRDCLNKNYEVYVWGSNTNYTLGIGSHQSRANPELLECFKRRNIPIVEVFMSKFHSAFLDYDGQLRTCGYGQGGRLGLGNESTILTPKRVPFRGSLHMVALGTNHTIVLDKEVYSFGLNTYHQLGHSPPPDKLLSPKQINSHHFKGVVVGIKASKYHSAFWTRTELYTCGLNGGQLGHSKSSANTIIVPKVVPINESVSLVASGDYAMVLATVSGDIYVLYNYELQKIKLGCLHPKMMEVRGGRFDHEFSSELLVDKGGDLLQILLIAPNNNIFLWQENGEGCFHCDTGLRREIDITDVAVNRNSVLFVFDNRMAFEGEIKTSQNKSNPDWNRRSHREPLRAHIKLKRIPYLHRVEKIACDIDGRNFAVVQATPKGRYVGEVRKTLKEDMKKVFHNLETSDYFQDVTFEVEGRRYSAHRYIVAYSSEVLEEMMRRKFETKGVCVVKIKNMEPETFSKLLNFMYTGNCCYCDPSTSLECSFCTRYDDEDVSAYEYYVKASYPLNLLRSGADRFKIKDLQRILKDEVPSSLPGRIEFERNALLYLQDLTIKSADGFEYGAHKFMLASRSEYFNIFISRWLDIAGEGKINLSVPGKVVKALLNYIYTDGRESMEGADVDFLILTYNAANEYLCYGFRDRVSSCLAKMLSLENASKIFHLASIYYDEQLKASCMSFICSNLTAFLEYRLLEDLSDSVLAELSEYYKKTHIPDGYRRITPYYDAPDDKLVGLIAKTEPVSLDSIEEELPIKSVSKTPKKRKRRSWRTRNASSSSFTSEEEPEPLEIIDFDDLNDKDEEESWVKVGLKKVVNHPPKQEKNVRTNVRTPVDASKVLDSPPEEDKFVTLNRAPDACAVRDLERKFFRLNTSSEEDFPALNASPVQKTVSSNPQTPRPSPKVFEKIVKLSQKQRKRLSAKSGSEEESVEKNEIKSPWGVSKIETQQLADIMKEESRGGSGNQRRVVWNPPWQSTEKPESSLSEVMESEKKRYEFFKRKRAIEDRAIEDLLLLYNANKVTGERITVMRANEDLVFLPF